MAPTLRSLHGCRLFAFTVALAMCGFLSAQASGAESSVTTSDEAGIRVRYAFEPSHDGAPGVGNSRVSITDALTGQPLRGVAPRAWLVRRRSALVAAEQTCEQRVAELERSSLGLRADVDLTSYRLVTLNSDDTVAFINPFVRLGGSQLESIVTLPSRGYDWAELAQRSRLIVSLADADRIGAIDTVRRGLLPSVELPSGSRPTRVLADSDGRRAWIGLDGRSQVALLDERDGVRTVEVGAGLHALALAEGTPWLAVTNSASNTLTVVHRETLAVVGHVPVAATPVAVAWSAAARQFVVTSANSTDLTLVDPESRSTRAITVERGALDTVLFDGGHLGFVRVPATDHVWLVDLARRRAVTSVTVAGGPDEIVLTEHVAFVRAERSATLAALPLAMAREGRLSPAQVAGGRLPPSEAPDRVHVTSSIVPRPDGPGIYIANGADGLIYLYQEGLPTLSGSISNYRRVARGLRVLDGALREAAPGEFVAATRFPAGGTYDVIVRNARPALTRCLTATVDGPSPESAPAHRTVSPRLIEARASAAGEWELRVALADGDSGVPLSTVEDAFVLVYAANGQWQRQVRLAERSDVPGEYTARVPLPVGMHAQLMARVESLGLAYRDARLGSIGEPPAGTP